MKYTIRFSVVTFCVALLAVAGYSAFAGSTCEKSACDKSSAESAAACAAKCETKPAGMTDSDWEACKAACATKAASLSASNNGTACTAKAAAVHATSSGTACPSPCGGTAPAVDASSGACPFSDTENRAVVNASLSGTSQVSHTSGTCCSGTFPSTESVSPAAVNASQTTGACNAGTSAAVQTASDKPASGCCSVSKPAVEEESETQGEEERGTIIDANDQVVTASAREEL